MFRQEILFELGKLRALRVHYMAFVGAVAVSVLSTFSLWASGASENFRALPAVLVSSGFFSALIWPIIIAVMASRLIDVEFSQRGWLLLVTAGCTVRSLIWAKGVVGCVLLALSAVVQSLLTLGICRLVGVMGANYTQWVTYYALLWVVNAVFFLFFIVVACVCESQIVVLLIGVASAFISVFCFLVPSILSYFSPWGYYSQIVPYRQDGNVMVATDVNGFAILCFSVVSVVFIAVVTRKVRIWR